MRKTILPSGLTIITEKKDSNSVAITIAVKVGSNKETGNILGISHFLEHMLFEGTKKRPNAAIISNEIETLGGEFNAFTTNEITVYYIKVLSKHFEVALDILSDMIQNSTFENKFIEKEKSVILKEINMVSDEPRFYQWILFYRNLFKNHPARNPTYGTVKTVKTISREDLVEYWKKHYTSGNIIVSIAGDIAGIDKLDERVADKFSSLKKSVCDKSENICREENTLTEKFEKKKILNSYMVIGYKVLPRTSHESYVLDVIKAILARGQSGKIIEKVRIEKGLAYEINLNHEANKSFGVFAVYFNTPKKNIPEIKSIIFREFANLSNVSVNDIEDAKGFIEGSYLLENEDNFKTAEKLAFWENIESAELHYEYVRKINSVSKAEIISVAKKILDGKFTAVRIE